MNFSIIALLLFAGLITASVVLAELYNYFDRMFRDSKIKGVKKWKKKN